MITRTTSLRLALATVALSAFTVCASAADLAPGTSYYGDPGRRPFDGSPRDGYTSGTNWTGLYVGGHGGWGAGQAGTTGATNRTIDLDGGLGGLHGGYNYQVGSLVAGIEGDIDWVEADGNRPFTAKSNINASAEWLSSMRVRLGYTTGQWMFYGTAGLALADLRMTFDEPLGSNETSKMLTGYAIGLGAELALTSSVSVRGEVMNYGFGKDTFDTSHGRLDSDLDVTTVRGGLSIKLN